MRVNSNRSTGSIGGISSRKGANLKQTRKLRKALTTFVVSSTVLTLSVWFWFLANLLDHQPSLGVHFLHRKQSTVREKRLNGKRRDEPRRTGLQEQASASSSPFCNFRKYPEHRYYKLNNSEQPEFLVSSEYIYGKQPIILKEQESPTKLCVDQEKWLPEAVKASSLVIPSTSSHRSYKLTWPFADGTNPSVLTMDRVKIEAPAVATKILKFHPDCRYIVTVCMTNSQCTWKDSAVDNSKFDLPDLKQSNPDTVRTMIQLLDASFVKLAETTIFLQLDAAWGRKHRQSDAEKLHVPALDDARLFLHDNAIYVSYREGPGFGYESQVLNRLHLEFTEQFAAQIRASETSSFCCGRNMALMNLENDESLYSLTWVDPVTVVKIDATPLFTASKRQQRRLTEIKANNSTIYRNEQLPIESEHLIHRQLSGKPHKSHIHGTNAFMIPFKEKNEYLGVAHFHRPNDRKRNEYARFGHHYTHAFYTVAVVDNSSNANDPQFRLTGLSREFVLPAATQHFDDAEIIQFVSGLEYNEAQQQVVLAYGINDCEGSITVLDYSVVKSMLVPVAFGKQVVDFMKPLSAR